MPVVRRLESRDAIDTIKLREMGSRQMAYTTSGVVESSLRVATGLTSRKRDIRDKRNSQRKMPPKKERTGKSKLKSKTNCERKCSSFELRSSN